MTIWKQLPDEVLNNVCEYWCPRKEQLYRRIKRMIDSCEYYSGGCYIIEESGHYHYKFNGKTMLERVKTLPFPDILKNYTERNIRQYIYYPPLVRITQKMCFITHRNEIGSPSPTITFNFSKGEKDYNYWLGNQLNCYFNKMFQGWTKILKEQYPEMYSMVQQDIKKKLKKIEEQKKQEKIQKELAEKKRQDHLWNLRQEEFERHQIYIKEREEQLINIFGGLPKYITSL